MTRRRRKPDDHEQSRGSAVRGRGPIQTGRTVDSAGDGEWSTTNLAARRALRRLLGRSSSTTERNGTATSGLLRHVGRSRSSTVPDVGTTNQLQAAAVVRTVPVRPIPTRWIRRPSEIFEQCDQLDTKLIEREFDGWRPDADEEKSGRNIALGEDRPEPATQSIARHSIADGAADGERHVWRRHREIVDVGTPNGPDPHPAALTAKPFKGCAGADPIDQAERLARPLSRRDFNTARPARVLMRARKPCFFERRRWFGW